MALQRLGRLRLRLIVVARTSAPLGGRRTGEIRTPPTARWSRPVKVCLPLALVRWVVARSEADALAPSRRAPRLQRL